MDSKRFVTRSRTSDDGAVYIGVHDTFRPSEWSTPLAIETYGTTKCLVEMHEYPRCEGSPAEDAQAVVDFLNAMHEAPTDHMSPNVVAVITELMERIHSKTHSLTGASKDELEGTLARLGEPRPEYMTSGRVSISIPLPNQDSSEFDAQVRS